MSKHKGNVVDPWQVLDQQGADAVRWYFYTTSAPWLPSRFSSDLVSEGQRKFMGTLWNTYAFYVLYANIDGFAPEGRTLDRSALSELDRWILSRLNSLVREVDSKLEDYDITGSGRAMQDFVDDLSNWYVRRSRERFWQPEMNADKQSAYMTLYTVLETLTRLSAPYVPFMAESMYQNLVAGRQSGAPVSVHLCDFPTADETFIDEALERRMNDVLHIVVMGRAARNTAAIKNRQPLSNLFVVAPEQLPQAYQDLVREELNVRALTYLDSRDGLLDYAFKPQLKTLGKKLGRLVPQVAAILAGLPGQATMKSLRATGELVLDVEGTAVHLTEEDLLIETIQPAGLAVESDRDFAVALDTTLTPELIEEGFVREIISKVQTMRKESGFDVSDRIVLRHFGSQTLAGVIARNEAFIADEVLASWIEQDEGPNSREWDINGQKVTLSVERIDTKA